MASPRPGVVAGARECLGEPREGKAYAKQGEHSIAVACLANGYRFSKNQTATRQFLQKLADDEDEEAAVRKAASQTLQLPLVQAAKD
jgi:hypothetical protein